jgi:hypothetical protein
LRHTGYRDLEIESVRCTREELRLRQCPVKLVWKGDVAMMLKKAARTLEGAGMITL